MLAHRINRAATMPETAELAALLLEARQTGHRLSASAKSGPNTVAQAYAVQRAVWLGLSRATRPSVWKLGAPDKQSEPFVAPVLSGWTASSPANFAAEDFSGLGIEAEIALRFGRDLPARADYYRRDEILDAIASVHVAMELVNTRLADPEAAGPLWRLADNLLNGALVIGEPIANWRELDFSGLRVRALADEHCLAETIGRPPLDDLFYCLPWWLAHNGGAQAGDIVTTGAWNGMHPVVIPAEVRVEFVGVGIASARIG